MENIVNIVSGLGFPIACVVALAWYIYRVEQSQTAAMQELKVSMQELKTTVELLSKMVQTIFNEKKGV